jgi:hypothetical protein
VRRAQETLDPRLDGRVEIDPSRIDQPGNLEALMAVARVPAARF